MGKPAAPKPKGKPSLPDPSEAVKAAIAEAEGRTRKRRERVGMRVETDIGEDGRKTLMGAPHSDSGGHGWQMLDAFGTSSPDFASASIEQLGRVCATGTEMDGQALNAALAIVDSIRPKDELEGAIATQIAASHAMSMKLMWKLSEAQTREARDSFATIVTKLQRTMTAQIDALARLRRKGEQNVTVKHVHVHRGGQAIVGMVNQTPGGAGVQTETSEQPHATRSLDQFQSAALDEMWSEDAIGPAVPVLAGGR